MGQCENNWFIAFLIMLNDKTASSRISFHFRVHSNCCSCLSSRILFHSVSCWSYSSSGILFNLSQFLVLFHSLSCWSYSSSRILFHFSQFLVSLSLPLLNLVLRLYPCSLALLYAPYFMTMLSWLIFGFSNAKPVFRSSGVIDWYIILSTLVHDF